MRKLDISDDAADFWSDLQAKQYRQIGQKIMSLLTDPAPTDAAQLRGYEYKRVDVGEYRIIYRHDEDTVYVALIGKRNDEVYRQLKRKG